MLLNKRTKMKKYNKLTHNLPTPLIFQNDNFFDQVRFQSKLR